VTTIGVIRPEDIAASDDPATLFGKYVRQTLGTPGMTLKDLAVLKKQTKIFFKENPQGDWYTLCRVVQWCRNHKKRPPRVYSVLSMVPYAWADGALPELNADREDVDVEEGISAALQAETDKAWRRRLLVASGRSARAEVLDEWRRANGHG